MTQPAPLADKWARSGQAPLWVAIALYAAANCDPVTGRATMSRGELRRELGHGATAATVSQAIRRAVAAGWLDASSTAWCLVLARSSSRDVARHGA